MNNRRIIKIVSITAVAALIISIGVLIFFKFKNKVLVGAIEFGESYQLIEMRPETFENVAMNKNCYQNSYFQINEDRKTGVMHFLDQNDQAFDIVFIVTDYTPGTSKTVIKLEYIYQEELIKLTAESNQDAIKIKSVRTHRVDITQENPNDTRNLSYSVSTLVFKKKEVA